MYCKKNSKTLRTGFDDEDESLLIPPWLLLEAWRQVIQAQTVTSSRLEGGDFAVRSSFYTLELHLLMPFIINMHCVGTVLNNMHWERHLLSAPAAVWVQRRTSRPVICWSPVQSDPAGCVLSKPRVPVVLNWNLEKYSYPPQVSGLTFWIILFLPQQVENLKWQNVTFTKICLLHICSNCHSVGTVCNINQIICFTLSQHNNDFNKYVKSIF